MKLFKNKLVWLFIVGLSIRLLLLFVDFSFDVNAFIAWGQELGKYGGSGFYDRQTLERYGGAIYPAYPPITIILFYCLTLFFAPINQLIWQINISIPVFPSFLVAFFQSRLFLAGLIKLLAVFGDLFLALVMYESIKALFRKHINKERLGFFGAALVLLNPVFIYTSALWGQIDSLPTAFVLSAIYFLFFTNREKIPFILLAISLLVKQTAIVTLPLFLIFFFRKWGLKKTIVGLLVGTGTFFLIFLPFYQSGNLLIFPFETYFSRILTASGIPFVSNHAFNFWALITQWQDIADSMPFFFGISYRFWGIFFVLGFLLPIFFIVLRKKLSEQERFLALSLSGFVVFSFLTRMHERHFQPVLVFLIPLAVTKRRFRMAFISLSVFHFANLYHNWAVPAVSIITDFIRTGLFENTMILLGLFCFTIMFKQFLNETKGGDRNE